MRGRPQSPEEIAQLDANEPRIGEIAVSDERARRLRFEGTERLTQRDALSHPAWPIDENARWSRRCSEVAQDPIDEGPTVWGLGFLAREIRVIFDDLTDHLSI
jgi:hypothetical protein